MLRRCMFKHFLKISETYHISEMLRTDVHGGCARASHGAAGLPEQKSVRLQHLQSIAETSALNALVHPCP